MSIHKIPRAELDTPHASLVLVLREAGLIRSAFEGAELVRHGLVSINGRTSHDEDFRLSEDDLISDEIKIKVRGMDTLYIQPED